MSAHALRDILDRLVTEMIEGGITLDEGRQALEARLIERAVDDAGGHLGQAADQLGHSPQHAGAENNRVSTSG